MGENSSIAWTDHTFNPWIGCTEVSTGDKGGCTGCYARTYAARFGIGWGNDAERKVTSEAYWRKPYSWDRAAAAAGIPARVFCGSLCDVMDKRAAQALRDRLWYMARRTPHLRWMFLTKRIGNAPEMLPADWGDGYPNAGLMTTVVTQAEADRDVPKLLAIPARWYGLSIEPQMEEVDVRKWLRGCHECMSECGWRSRPGLYPPEEKCGSCGHVFFADDVDEFCPHCGSQDWSGVCPDCGGNTMQGHPDTRCLDLVITGGESAQPGHEPRPYELAWPRSLLRQCEGTGTSVFVKQLGSHPRGEWTAPGAAAPMSVHAGRFMLKDRAGGDPKEWPADLRVQLLPAALTT